AEAFDRYVTTRECRRDVFDQHILELHFEIFDRLAVAVGAHHLKFGFRNGLAAGAGLGQERRRQIDQLVDADLAELGTFRRVAAAGRRGCALGLVDGPVDRCAFDPADVLRTGRLALDAVQLQ
ncbi:conserved hypothetical protein, partial [Ricinus communis]